MTEQLKLRGILQGGHSGPITQVATTPSFPDMILSASKDKSIVVWALTMDGTNFGVPKKSLVGHSDIVSDVTISSDGMFALSGSWDGTLRYHHVYNKLGATTRVFQGHTKGVRSVAFSTDNRRIASGSLDCHIKLWNTLGQCIHTIEEDVHSEWVTCVRFSNHSTNPILVSCSTDRVVKVWDTASYKLKNNFFGHTAYVNSVAISPDCSLCASGGKDYRAMLWDLNQGKHFCTLDGNIEINALAFSPNRYWLCVAAGGCIRIWDLDSKAKVQEVWIEPVQNLVDPECTSLAWSANGQMLYAGCTDGVVRVFEVAV